MQQWYQCPRCSAQVAYGTRFCGNCGTQLNWPTQQQTQPPPPYKQQRIQQSYQCSSCGSPNAFGQQFCGACGKPLALRSEEKRRGTSPWLIILVVFIAVVFIGGGLLLAHDTSTSTSSLSSNLLIYLDENYTKPWDKTNIPDLNNLVWSASPSEAGWETSTLTAFLKNVGNIPIKVNATSSERPGLAFPGFSVSSDSIVIKPNEYSPINITIDVRPDVDPTLYSNKNAVTIYFHVVAAN